MKRFILLLWLLLVANPGSACALKPGVAESRVCQPSFLPLAIADHRPAVDRKQSPCLLRAHGGCIYDGGLKLTDFRGLRLFLHAYDGPGVSGGSSMGEPPNKDPFGSDQGDTDLDRAYLPARSSHPTPGLFATLDPFAGNQSDPLSLHKYLYCHDDPVNRIDPSGHVTMAAAEAYSGIRA